MNQGEFGLDASTAGTPPPDLPKPDHRTKKNWLSLRLERDSKLHAPLRAGAEKLSVGWEYSHKPLWHWHPVESAGLRLAAASPGEAPATATHHSFAVARDAQGRVVILRENISTVSAAETILRYNGSRAIATRFILHPSPVSQSAFELALQDGRVMAIDWIDRNWTLSESTFAWGGARLVSSQVRWDNGPLTEFRFDESGRSTARFRVRPDGTRLQLDAPLPKGVTLKALAETIRARLGPAIRRTIAAAGIDESAYCVALVYDTEGGGYLPPMLAVGVESQRQTWLGGVRKPSPGLLWNPAEFRHYQGPGLHLDEPELEQACEQYMAKLESRGSLGPARKLLNAVAKELSQACWNGGLETTPDFVVYAVDLELADLRKNLKESAPPQLFEQFKNQKYV